MQKRTQATIALLLALALLVMSFPLTVFAAEIEEDATEPIEPVDEAPSEDVIREAFSDVFERDPFASGDIALLDGPLPSVVPMADFNSIWFQGYVYQWNENAGWWSHTYQLKDGTHTSSILNMTIKRLKVDGRYVAVYCTEPDTSTHAGVDYGDPTNMIADTDWKANLYAQQQKAIAIAMLYSAKHHPTVLEGVESVEWEIATQIIIWEIVMGMRSTTPPYACTDSSLIGRYVGGNGARYNDKTTNHYLTGLKSKYDTLSNDLALHSLRPSFSGRYEASAPTYEMELQSDGSYRLELTDTNGVLARFPYSSQGGITVTTSGNKLILTAPAKAQVENLSFAANHPVPNVDDSSCLFRVFHMNSSSEQDLISPPTPESIPMDPVPAYFKISIPDTPGTMTAKKTSSGGKIEGYTFRLWYADANRTWCGKSDSEGNIYKTPSNFSEPATREYTFTGFEDGSYILREIISGGPDETVFPTWCKITVTDRNGATTYDHTFTGEELRRDTNGDCLISSFKVTGLSNGGRMTIAMNNETVPGTMTIVKTSSGDVEGYPFRIWNATAKKAYYGISDDQGKVYATNAAFAEPDEHVYEFPNLLDGTYDIREVITQATGNQNVFPSSWTIKVTDRNGIETYNKTFTGSALINNGGDCVLNGIKLTGLSGGGKLTMIINNEPLDGKCKIIKTCLDGGSVEGWTFAVDDAEGNRIGTYTTDSTGVILADLLPGTYVITELLDKDSKYECVSDNPQQVTIAANETATVQFANQLKPGRIMLSKSLTDGSDVIGFRVRIERIRVPTRGSSELAPPVMMDPFTFVTCDPTGAFYLLNDNGQATVNRSIEAYDSDTLEFRELLKDSTDPVSRYIPKEITFTLTKADGNPGTLTWHGKAYTGKLTVPVSDLTAIGEEGGYLFDFALSGLCTEGLSGGGKLEISVVNTPRPGSIAIHKVNTEKKDLGGAVFLLEWFDTVSESWTPVTAAGTDDVVPGTCTSPDLRDGKLTTDSETGLAVFVGLHPGCRYRLTEVSAPEGYTLLSEPAFDGFLPQADGYVVELTVVNSHSYELPHTGGSGVFLSALGVAALLSGSFSYLFWKKRKE